MDDFPLIEQALAAGRRIEYERTSYDDGYSIEAWDACYLDGVRLDDEEPLTHELSTAWDGKVIQVELIAETSIRARYRVIGLKAPSASSLIDAAMQLITGGDVKPSVILLPTSVPGLFNEIQVTDE